MIGGPWSFAPRRRCGTREAGGAWTAAAAAAIARGLAVDAVEVIGDFDFGPGGDVTVSNLEVLPICG
ncbi:MAG: hypothetical protein K1X88_17155 [Nannocystaceae bacterium]|nr:hypothetical protein [Nannocystaceae bacterium]